MKTRLAMTQTAKTAMITTAALFLGIAASQPRPASGCEECQLQKAGTYLGQFTLMGNGTVRSWVKLDKAGKPTSLGVTFSETALSNLPQKLPPGMIMWEHSLALPKEAAITGFDHISMDWTPQGHEPPRIYDVPHFDVHFYMATKAELNKITATGSDLARAGRKPEARFLPAGYILPPKTEIPRMGAHAVDVGSPELHGKPFAKTFIYGYYNGKMNFIEPMIARSFLETKPDFTAPVKQPQAYPKRGYYPTSYSIKYDPVRQEYTVSLDGLTLRHGISAAPNRYTKK